MKPKTLIERKEYLRDKDYDTIISLIYDWVITGQITIREFKMLLEYIYKTIKL